MNRFVQSIAVLSIVLSVVFVAGTGMALADVQEPAGNGTSSDPYQVTNWSELRYMNESLDSYYELQNDITPQSEGYDDHASTNANGGAGWKPVGINSPNEEFSGTLDGQGYAIDALYIDRPTENLVGLFRTVSDANISNVSITDVEVNGDEKVGGLIGSTGGTTTNVNNVMVNGTVTGPQEAGGLVGFLGGQSEIDDSYSLASVSGGGGVGGLTGRNGFDATIYYSYAAGSVSGDADVGGLAGVDDGDILGSYVDIDKISQGTQQGTNLTTSEMQGSEAESNMNFDFSNKYETVESEDSDATNDGYPVLQSLDREGQLLAQDGTDPVSQYDLTIETDDSDSNSINTTFSVADSGGAEVVSGETGSDGLVSVTLEEGDYTITVASDDSAYNSKSRTTTLDSDKTESFSLSKSTYDLTVETDDDVGYDSINTTYSVTDSSGTEVASGETGSGGSVSVTLEEGDYTVSVAESDPEYDSKSRTTTLDSSKIERFVLSESQYDLIINTENGSGDSIDTDYSITDSGGTEVASGQTGSDGQVVEMLPYGTYTVSVAENDPEFKSGSTTHELKSDYTMTFQRNPQTYDLTIKAENGNGDSVDTDYSVDDADGNEVASGQTGSDGSATETLTQGDYTITVASSDSTYVDSTRSITLSSDTTESFTLSTESYDATIRSQDAYEQVSTDYSIENTDGNVVASGTTQDDSSVTETLDAGTYTITYAGNDDELYTTQQTFTLDSDNKVVDSTIDRIGLSLSVDQGAIYTGNEVTLNADVENRDDANYNFDWYVNNESVATDYDDTLNYTFNDSGEYKIRVESTIDGEQYVATRPIPDFGWVDVEEEDDPQNNSYTTEDKKIEFEKLEVNTVDSNGSVVATHLVNANLRENLTGDQINEDRIRVARKGETTEWQVIATHDAYVRAEHPDYQNRFAEVDYTDLQTTSLYSVTLGFGEGNDSNVNSTSDKPDRFGYDLIQDAVITTVGDGTQDVDGPALPIPGVGGVGGLFGLFTLLVIGASALFLVSGFGLLRVLIPGAGGEGVVGGGEDSILDSIPNPLRLFDDD